MEASLNGLVNAGLLAEQGALSSTPTLPETGRWHLVGLCRRLWEGQVFGTASGGSWERQPAGLS